MVAHYLVEMSVHTDVSIKIDLSSFFWKVFLICRWVRFTGVVVKISTLLIIKGIGQ